MCVGLCVTIYICESSSVPILILIIDEAYSSPHGTVLHMASEKGHHETVQR